MGHWKSTLLLIRKGLNARKFENFLKKLWRHIHNLHVMVNFRSLFAIILLKTIGKHFNLCLECMSNFSFIRFVGIQFSTKNGTTIWEIWRTGAWKLLHSPLSTLVKILAAKISTAKSSLTRCLLSEFEALCPFPFCSPHFCKLWTCKQYFFI